MESRRMNIDLMKQYNKTAILRCIRENAPISRAEVSDFLNLSRPSVSGLVSELIEDGWLREMTRVKGGRGRRPIPLEINPEERYVIGVELGAYRITTILCNLRADILARESFPMEKEQSVSSVLDRIAATVPMLLQRTSVEHNQLLGVGVAMHGPVDFERGVSIFAPNLGWRNTDIGKELRTRVDLPTLVENDCISSGLGERWFGHGQTQTNFITLMVDYGVGAGIVFNGKTYRGAHHVAGQLGHTTVAEDGPRCSCGNHGCLEVMSSEPALVRQAEERILAGQPSSMAPTLQRLGTLDVEDIYRAAEEGDSLALHLLRDAGRYLGIGVANLVNILDPQMIVLGGGITRAAEFVLPAIHDVVLERAMGDDSKQTPVIVSQLGDNLYPIGGATLIIEQVFEAPIEHVTN